MATILLIVIAEKYGDGLEGRDVREGVGEWVNYMQDSTQLHGLIARLTAEAGNL